MDGLTQIAKQRAERFKKHKYSTPLPFDVLANPPPPAPVETTRKSTSTGASGLGRAKGHYSDNSSSSDRSNASTDPTSTSDYSPATTGRERQPVAPKHVPLDQLVDFRVSHARQSKSRGRREPLLDRQQLPLEAPPRDQKQQPLQRIVRDGVPHLMTRESSVMVESVEGVPLTTTLNSHANPGNHPTLPEFEAEEIREIDLPTAADDLRLEAEFERYRRHYARPPPAIWHGPQYEDTAAQRMSGRRQAPETEEALWTKDGWKTRTRQISPRPANRGADHVFVDGYSDGTAALTVKGQEEEDWKRIRASSLRRGILERRAPSFRSEKSAAPAPSIPLLSR